MRKRVNGGLDLMLVDSRGSGVRLARRTLYDVDVASQAIAAQRIVADPAATSCVLLVRWAKDTLARIRDRTRA